MRSAKKLLTFCNLSRRYDKKCINQWPTVDPLDVSTSYLHVHVGVSDSRTRQQTIGRYMYRWRSVLFSYAAINHIRSDVGQLRKACYACIVRFQLQTQPSLALRCVGLLSYTTATIFHAWQRVGVIIIPTRDEAVTRFLADRTAVALMLQCSVRASVRPSVCL